MTSRSKSRRGSSSKVLISRGKYSRDKDKDGRDSKDSRDNGSKGGKYNRETKDEDRQSEVIGHSFTVSSRKDVTRERPVGSSMSRWVFTKQISPKITSKKQTKWLWDNKKNFEEEKKYK